MNIREQTEDIEKTMLHPMACPSSRSRGRALLEDEGDIRTCFQRDRDRIIHSKSFRRLKHKTQVFLAPKGDHYRTRLTHVLEVSQIARTISRALRLNEDLTEAIALVMISDIHRSDMRVKIFSGKSIREVLTITSRASGLSIISRRTGKASILPMRFETES